MSLEIGPRSIVGAVRQSLQAVSDFSILKELLQNADDSGAHRWALGWHPGVQAAHHPLLAGPAMFVVNDGPFRPQDARAICQLHVSGKASDPGTIGKFGLGLKSVYHLCEAFFYVGSDADSSVFEARYPNHGLLSPWVLREDHPDNRTEWSWETQRRGDAVAPAANGDLALLRSVLEERTGWAGFALWVPLRLDQHTWLRNGQRAYVHSQTFDDEPFPSGIFNGRLQRNLRLVAPMLRHLREYQVLGPDASTTFSLTVAGEANNLTRRYPLPSATPEAAVPNGREPFRGRIEGSGTTSLYAGVESGLRELNVLRSTRHWPSTTEQTTTEQVQVPDKSVPHAAVVFVATPTEGPRGRLEVSRAVFLPVSEASEETVPLQAPFDVRITLHGYYFLSPDRTSILAQSHAQTGESQNELDLMREWNTRLEAEAVLPLVLDALSAFARDIRQVAPEKARDSDVVAQVTRALAGSRLFRERGRDVTAGRAWVRRWHSDGRRTWALANAQIEVLACPDVRALQRLAPTLEAQLGDAVLLVQSDDAFLMHGKPLETWGADRVGRLLRAIDAANATTPEGLRHLADFLEPQLPTAEDATALADDLVEVLQQLMRRLSDQANETLQDSLRRLLALLPIDRRLSLPRRSEPDLVRRIQELALTVVVYPEIDGLDDASRLSIRDAHAILRACGGNPKADDLVRQVLRRTDSPEKLMESLRDIPLLSANVATEQRLVSYSDLRAASARGRLFDRASNQYTFVANLQACLREIPLVQVDAEVAQFVGLTAARGDLPAVARMLERLPPLVEAPEPRVELLRSLLVSGTGQGSRRVHRYLLSNNPGGIEGNDLLVYPRTHAATAGAVAAKVLQAGPMPWRWLPFGTVLDEKLTGAQLETLGARAADDEVVATLLLELGDDPTLPSLEPNEYDYLLRTVDDIDLARRLPIHDSTSGVRVVITDRAWLESGYLDGFHGDAELLEGIDSIRRHPSLLDRQERLGLRPIDAVTVVQHAMGRSNPERYWREVLGVLPQVSMDVELMHLLRDRSWLPTRRGAPVSPRSVVHLPDLAELITSDLLDGAMDTVHFDDLSSEVREHSAITALDPIFLPRAGMLARLGAALVLRSEYQVGELDQAEVPASEDAPRAVTAVDWRDAMGAENDAFPLAAVFHRLDSVDAETLMVPLLVPIDATQCANFLVWLRERHRGEKNRARRETILRVYDAYLAVARTTPDWSIGDPTLLLMSKAGTWQTPSALTHGQDNVDPSSVVSPSHAAILELHSRTGELNATDIGSVHVLPQTEAAWARVDDQLAETARSLEAYFSPWLERGVRPEPIGGLLALMGDHAEIRVLARRYLGSFSVDEVRRGLETEPFAVVHDRPNTLQDKVAVHRFVVRVEHDATFTVPNLLGRPIEVPAATDLQSLVAGRVVEPKYNDGTYYMGLRLLQPATTAPHELRRLLIDTAELLFRSVYNFPARQISTMFDKLDHSEHLDLAVVQDLFFKSAPQYLRRQLGARAPHLDALILDIERVRIALAERRHLEAGSETEADLHAEEAAIAKLRSAIETDGSLHGPLLDAVRRKLHDYQYLPSSVPFELLQNADDALGELQALEPGTPTDRRFVVARTPEGFDVLYWGRPINRGNRELDHHRDLEKMLVLNASDKGEEAVGKFGLGFKSVFLVADRPQVVSRDLAFEVIGGVYPKRLPADVHLALREARQDHGSSTGTLVRLRADDGLVHEALERFIRFAPFVLMFTRHLRRIDLEQPSGLRTIEPTIRDASVPHLQLADLHEAGRVALIGDRSLGIALRFDGTGFGAFEPEVPRVWVTTPTAEVADFAFLIHGAFEVDTGRQSLATASEANVRRARRFANTVHETLCTLDELTSEARAATFGPFATERNTFWTSLFDVLSTQVGDLRGRNDAHSLAYESLWSESGGALRTLRERDTLPTRLSEPYDSPTRIGRVLCVTRGDLSDPIVFGGLARLPRFQEAHPFGTVVAANVANRLAELGVDLDASDLSIADAVRHAIGPDSLMTPTVAAVLGGWWHNATSKLREDVAEAVVKQTASIALFKTMSGTYLELDEVVGPNDDDLVLQLAPESSRLSSDYDTDALTWFATLRGQRPLGPLQVARWIADATTDVGRIASVRFLLGSEVGFRTSMELRGLAAGSWLAKVGSYPPPCLHVRDRLMALLGLRLPELPPLTTIDEPNSPVYLPHANADELFHWLANRWREQGAERLQKYEAATYPWELRLARSFDPTDLQQRRDWMTLLLLGALRSLGRTRPGQHREFVKLWQDKGWLSVAAGLAAADQGRGDRSRAWLRIMQEFLDPDQAAQDDEYRYWMGQFMTVFQLSTWLEEYVHLMIGLERTSSEDEAMQIWTPASAPMLSGSGISAPTLHRVMRIGKHFVIRELLRLGIVQNARLDALAYVPSVGLRDVWKRVLSQLPEDPTEASKTIHANLVAVLGVEGARFGGAYDLAFGLLVDRETR